jgi:L-seryl-tRNA(Ser) seleniumtransferase
MAKHLLRNIPPVHELLTDSEIIQIQKKFALSNQKIKKFIQDVLHQIREDIKNDTINLNAPIKQTIISRLEKAISNWNQPNLKRVINATGTILHTNLGRARLSDEAIHQVMEVAKNYSNLEYNLEKGTRGSRHSIVEDLLKEVTGAEAAIVVNNNAASVYFILRCFAKHKEVIVSRGELVEIGGNFRVSSIMEESDAQLVEVGTTNRTHLYDYENAITENTAMLLKVHQSNFSMKGFTKSVERKELVQLAKDNHLIYFEDLGSGALFDFSSHNIGNEPTIQNILKDNPDLISFSGDKLLGGPQVGIIVGKKVLIDKLKKHQLARVLRVDKMTYAALEITLKQYAKGMDHAMKSIPSIRDIVKPVDKIKHQVIQCLDKANQFKNFTIKMEAGTSMIGGGTMPEVQLDTYGIMLKPISMSVSKLEQYFRNHELPVIGRLVHDHLFFDFRTLTIEEIELLMEIIIEIDNQL